MVRWLLLTISCAQCSHCSDQNTPEHSATQCEHSPQAGMSPGLLTTVASNNHQHNTVSHDTHHAPLDQTNQAIDLWSLTNIIFLFQVNYFKDHTKLIVGGERQPMLTYINSERQSRTWLLADLARRGGSAQVKERMSYVASVLEEFAELDEQSESC